MVVYNQDRAHGSHFISKADEDIFDPGVSHWHLPDSDDIAQKETRNDLQRSTSTRPSTGEDDRDASSDPNDRHDQDKALIIQNVILHETKHLTGSC